MTTKRRYLVLVLALVLVAAAACQWPGLRGGPTNDAFNNLENTLSRADAGSVGAAFTADLGAAPDGWQTPVVSASTIFAPVPGAIGAFDLNGVTGCSGTPKVCAPLWRGDTGGRQVATAPSLDRGTMYVTAGAEGSGTARLFAFDPTGQVGCSGSPTWCQPLWSADGVGYAAPVVINGTVYAATNDGAIAAFDATGTTGCSGSPKVCAPLWRTEPGLGTSTVNSPAVADGTLFATTFDGELLAFDAAGVDGCAGAPVVCHPIWTATTGGLPHAWPVAPVVSAGRIYVAFDTTGELGQPLPVGAKHTLVHGFALDGGPSCVPAGPASIPACPPAWTADVAGTIGTNELAAAYGSLYLQIVAETAPYDSSVVALATDDPGCTPGPCGPTWTAAIGPDAGLAAPIVANHTVYVDKAGATVALDAHGVAGCTGSPATCTPVPFATQPDAHTTGIAVSDGKLFAITNDGAAVPHHTLRVFARLPAPAAPLRLGGARNYLGTGDLLTGAARESAWLSVSGYCARNEHGDRIAPYADANGSGAGRCDATSAAGAPRYNPEYSADGYFYAVTFPAGATGAYKLEVYDAAHCQFEGSGVGDSGSDGSSAARQYQFIVRGNNANDPLQATVLSSTTVSPADCPTYRAKWVTLQTLINPSGTYYLQVKPVIPVAKNIAEGQNQFGLRVYTDTFSPCTSDPTVAGGNVTLSPACPNLYAVNHLGLYAAFAGTTPSYFLASVGAEHAGKTMEVELFDPAEGAQYIELLDPNGNAVTFTWEVACKDATYLSEVGGQCTTGEAAPTGGYGNTTSNKLSVSGSGIKAFPQLTQADLYSDRLLRLKVSLPANYAAIYGSNTWWRIRYTVCSGAECSIGDRTTWSVAIH